MCIRRNSEGSSFRIGNKERKVRAKKSKYHFLLHWVIFRVNMYIVCESKSKGEGGVKTGEE